jgi:hypothetical protein
MGQGAAKHESPLGEKGMNKISGWRRIALAGSLVAAVSACGSGGGTPVVNVTSVTPSDGASKVNVQSTIQVAFDGALDPASVTRANIRVLSQGIPVPTRLSYDDAAHTVTIDPMGNLTYGQTYTVSISGVESAGQQPVAAQQARFATWLNPLAWDEVHEYVGDYIPWRDVYDRLADGSSRYRRFDDPGPDGQWGTADDVLSNYGLTTTRAGDGTQLTAYYSGAGADGQWFTADDTQYYGMIRSCSADGRSCTDVGLSGPGPDGRWFTADDVKDGTSTQVTVTADGAPLTELDIFDASGAGELTVNTYNADGTLAQTVDYDDPGPDGVWGTADDHISAGDAYVYDQFGRVARDIDSAGPLPPGPGNPSSDDCEHNYRPDGRLDNISCYAGGSPPAPGAQPLDVRTFQYDAAGNLTLQGYAGDAIHVNIWKYDQNNNRTSSSSGFMDSEDISSYDTSQ